MVVGGSSALISCSSFFLMHPLQTRLLVRFSLAGNTAFEALSSLEWTREDLCAEEVLDNAVLCVEKHE